MKKNHSYAGYFRQHLFKILLAFVLSALATAGTSVNTHILSIVISDVSDSRFANIWIFAFLLLAIEVASILCNFLAQKVILLVKTSITKGLHEKLASSLAKASTESVQDTEPVTLTQKMREGNNFVNAVHSIYEEIFSIFSGIVAFVYTAYYSWQIAVLFIIFLIIILFIQIVNIKIMVKKQKQADSASDKSHQLLVEIIEGFSDIKTQNLFRGIKSHFETTLSNEIELNVASEKVIYKNSLISQSILAIYKTSFIILGIWLVMHGSLSFKAFTALFMYKGDVYGLVGSILRVAKNKSRMESSMNRMNEILHYQTVSKEHFGNTTLIPISGNISINNLTVIRGETKLLDNISVELPSSSFIGIVGDSGCGKSSLLKVLARELAPTSGDILLDGVSLWDLNEWSYRKAITLAPQQPYLFSKSIKENLLLANPEASDAAIWDCLKQCSADEFVREKGGLNTILSPKKLSGGQRQRLALARIPLRGGKIVLLDESTSALDSKSQESVIQTIREAANMGHTMILVAHRISTLKSADKILLMKNGKVIETGTYNELYKKSEEFRCLAID